MNQPPDCNKLLADAGLLELVTKLCSEYLVTIDEVLAQCKTRRISLARQAIWAEVREIKRNGVHVYSYPDIGRLFGREHTTIIAGIDAHYGRLAAAKRAA